MKPCMRRFLVVQISKFIRKCFIVFLLVILFLLFRWEEEQLPEGVKWLKMEHKVNQMNIGCIHKWQLGNYFFVIMLIILTSLISVNKIQNNFCCKLRVMKMISTIATFVDQHNRWNQTLMKIICINHLHQYVIKQKVFIAISKAVFSFGNTRN